MLDIEEEVWRSKQQENIKLYILCMYIHSVV